METTTTKLFWQHASRIGCPEHTPFPRSATWVWDDWRPSTDPELRGYERAVGRPAKCETCAAIERRVTSPPF